MPQPLFLGLFAVLGVVIGALTAHLAEAVMAHRRFTAPACPHCTTAYSPLQWSALLALVTGRWRCQSCGKGLRLPRLLAELFLGASFALLLARYGLSWRVILAMAALIPLAMILVTDIETRLIPNKISLPALGVMLVVSVAVGPALPFASASGNWWRGIAGALIGFLVMRILVTLGVAVFGEGALGEGDITLAAYIGAIVGYPLIFEALVLAFLIGGVGAFVVLITQHGGLRTAIPYGPFLILGCATTIIWGQEILFWFLS